MKKREDSQRELKIARFRREIEILLHDPLREEEWVDLVEEGYIEELLSGDSPLTGSEIADKVRKRRQVYGQRGAKKGRASLILSQQEVKDPSGRLKALSLLVAQEAAKDEEVQAFRTEVLSGKLLALEEVEGWIQKQAKAEGSYTWLISEVPIADQMIDQAIGAAINVRITDKREPLLPFTGKVNVRITTHKDNFLFHFLKYSTPDAEEHKEIPTSLGGTLERLRWLSGKLAEEYGWTEAEATVFVLAGAIPEIIPMTFTFQSKRLAALSRIVLTVDPTLSPKEVAEFYRRIRQHVLPGRHRELSEKHMQLALFAANRSEETWSDKMAEWNRTHAAEWKYEEVANFSHDCLQARRRLLRSE